MHSYDNEVKNRPGKNIPVTDTLSRKPLKETGHDFSHRADIQVNMVTTSLPVHSKEKQENKSGTEKNKNFQY